MSTQVRPGYKLTEVGVIPDDWDTSRLSDLAELTSSKRIFEHDYVPTGIPFYRGKEISLLISRKAIEDPHFISEEKFNEIKQQYGAPKTGDILITAVGTLGNIFVVNSDNKFYFKDGNLIWLRSINSSDSNYIGAQLNKYKSKILDGAIGSSQKALTIVVLSELQIPVPPLLEQRAIAEALSDMDAMISGLDQLIAKKRDIKQAAMQQLLTGQLRLPGFSGDWEKKQLGDVLSRMANGASYKQNEKFGVPVTRIETIATGVIDLERVGLAAYSSELDKYKIEIGDILFSHINSVDHIGKVAYFGGGKTLYHGMNLLLLRAGASINNNFLFLLLSSEFMRRNARVLAKQAVSQASINTAELKGVELLIPSLPEQAAIATTLSDMDNELIKLETRRDKARQLKQGMMQELLTGRIRLSQSSQGAKLC